MASTQLLVIVFILDLVAFALAVTAEQRRNKGVVNKSATQNYCVYESDMATGLGVGALVILLASQALIMVASRCFCCGKPLTPGRSRVWAIILFITCWFTFIVAEACLLAGSVRNAYHTKYRTAISDNPPSCETLRKGIFGAGAAFIFFTGITTELYYISYSNARNSYPPSRETGVGMNTYR